MQDLSKYTSCYSLFGYKNLFTTKQRSDEHRSMTSSAILFLCLLHDPIPYIANRSRWKSFTDGQGTSNSLENFRGSFTQVKICSCAYLNDFINRTHLFNNSE